MNRFPPKFKYTSLKISRRGLLNQSMNPLTGYVGASLPAMCRKAMAVMLPLSLRSNTGLSEPSQMLTLSCRRNSSKSMVENKVSHLLEISCMYYTFESRAAAMCTDKAIHALCQHHQTQKNKPQKSASQCSNCTCSHTPGHDNCPA